MLAHSKIQANAQAGQKIFWREDAKIEAIVHAQIAVINHWTGEAQLAIAREIDNGIFTIATTNADFQFDLNSFIIFSLLIFIKLC